MGYIPEHERKQNQKKGRKVSYGKEKLSPRRTLQEIKEEFHPNWDWKKIVEKLPQKEYWTSPDLCKVFEVSVVALCRACRKYGIARKIPSTAGQGGSWVFVLKDVQDLCYILQGRRKHEGKGYSNERKRR